MKRSFGVICGVLAACLLVSGCVRDQEGKLEYVGAWEGFRELTKKSPKGQSPATGGDVDISGARNKPGAPTQPETVLSKNGLTVELHGCAIVHRNNIDCKFTVTSMNRDREVYIGIWPSRTRPVPIIYDDASNEYSVVEVHIANLSKRRNGVSSINRKLLADLPTRCIVKFRNISTQAKSIRRLIIPIRAFSDGKSRKVGYINYTFRNISIS